MRRQVRVLFAVLSLSGAAGCSAERPREEPPPVAVAREALVDEGLLLPGSQTSGFGAEVAVAGDTAMVLESGVLNGTRAGRVYEYTRSGNAWVAGQEIREPEVLAPALFHGALAFDGDTLVVGADFQAKIGAAYVYVRSGGQWTRQAKLVPPDAPEYAHIGSFVALDGDTVLVGGPGDAGGIAALVYVRSGGTWSFQAKLLPAPPAQPEQAGTAKAAISGDTAFVSHPDADRATVDVFERTGTSWTRTATLETEDANLNFGTCLAVQGDTLLVGSTVHGVTSSGRIEVFRRVGTAWTYQESLKAGSDSDSLSMFGISVGFDGDFAVVGASNALSADQVAGAAYLYARAGEHFTEQAKLYYPLAPARSHFGRSVAIFGGHVLVGAPSFGSSGAVQSFEVGRDDGAACTAARSCKSGYCVSGVCCSSACTGTCSACSAAEKWSGPDGTCGRARPGVACGNAACADGTHLAVDRCDASGACAPSDPVECPGGAACSGDACLADLGAGCFHGGQCGSGHCVDGVCCDAPCGGGEKADCQACSIRAGGTCDGHCGPSANGSRCDDGAECTGPDVCTNGTCGGPNSCCSTKCDSATDPGCECDDQLDQHCNLKDPLPDGAPCGYGMCLNWFCTYPYVAASTTFAPPTATYTTGKIAADGDRFVSFSGSQARVYRVDSPDSTSFTIEPGVIDSGVTPCIEGRLAISGDTVATGCVDPKSVTPGAAAVYQRDASGTWTKLQAIAPSNPEYVFARDLALDGDRLVIGATQGTGPLAGVALAFERTGGLFQEVGTIVSAAERLNTVAVSGDTVALGIGEHVEVFVGGGATWTKQARLDPVILPGLPLRTLFGAAIALQGDTLVVGAPEDNEPLGFAGAVYVYRRTGTSWSFTAKLAAESPGRSVYLGTQVAIHGAHIVGGRKFGKSVLFTDLGGGVFDAVDLVPEMSRLAVTESFVASGYALWALDRPSGAACLSGGSCASGHCVDGVCCDTACDATCGVCSAAKGASADGTCSPRQDGTACDDGDACTTVDACSAGKCVGTQQVDCGADPECQASTCDPKTGACCTTNLPEHTACSTGECRSGACAEPAPPGIDAAGGASGAGDVGSSRVDLQACKLEYSIVSPK